MFLKILKKIFLTPKKWKNGPQKLLIIGPDSFFPLTSPGHSIAYSILFLTSMYLQWHFEKMVFLKKNSFTPTNFFLSFFYSTFQCGCSSVFKKKFLAPKKWKNGPQKLLIIGPDPFFPTVQPRPQPTAQNWFSISWNLGTRHLFSYLSIWYPFCWRLFRPAYVTCLKIVDETQISKPSEPTRHHN